MENNEESLTVLIGKAKYDEEKDILRKMVK